MTKKPFFQIALPCFLTGIISAMSLTRIGFRYFSDFVPPPILLRVAIIYFLTILFYLAIGIRKTIRKAGASSSLLAFWQAALRYFLALDLCVFGVCKFFHIQFNTPLALLDNPFNTLSDSQLMWAFFGHSYAFTLLIGGMEIVGALMLLFSKTRLPGVFFLLPVCLNIFFLDVFYNDAMTSIYIAIEITGLIYLLLIDYNRLVKFFFIDKSDLPQFIFKRNLWKNTARLSVIIIPFLLMAIVKYPQHYPEINGKYEVKGIMINNMVRSQSPCTDSVLTKVYFDKNDLVFEYNSYRRRFIGSYTYNAPTKQIVGIWRYPSNQHDTLFAKILPGNAADAKVLTGHMGKEVFKIDLMRVNNGD